MCITFEIGLLHYQYSNQHSLKPIHSMIKYTFNCSNILKTLCCTEHELVLDFSSSLQNDHFYFILGLRMVHKLRYPLIQPNRDWIKEIEPAIPNNFRY